MDIQWLRSGLEKDGKEFSSGHVEFRASCQVGNVINERGIQRRINLDE